jgi:hypothetical protein
MVSLSKTCSRHALVGISAGFGKADAISDPSGSHGDLTEIGTGWTHCRADVKDRVFNTDRAFFTANPDRCLYCREFIEGEFLLEVIELPAGYRPVVVVWLIAKWDGNQVRDRRLFGLRLLVPCPNDSDRAIVAAFGPDGTL